MSILQNKKALIGIVAGVVLVMLLAFFVMPMLSGGGDSGSSDSAGTPPPAPGSPPLAPSTPGAPPSGTAEIPPTGPSRYPGAGIPPGGPSAAGTAVASAKPLAPSETHRRDPFSPLIPPYKPSARTLMALAAEREIASLPPLTIYEPRPTTLAEGGGSTPLPGIPSSAAQQPDTSQRRVAGIVYGKNASAILEVDGQTAVVKPGDILPDLSRVERIERDRVLLRKGGRAIFVPLSSNPGGAAGGPVTGGGVPPSGPYGPGRRLPGVPPPFRPRPGG